MARTQVRSKNIQDGDVNTLDIADNAISKSKLSLNFLNNSDLDLTQGLRNATLSGLANPTQLSHPVTLEYFQNVINSLSIGFNFSFKKIASGTVVHIPLNQQMIVFGQLTIDGSLTIEGELICL